MKTLINDFFLPETSDKALRYGVIKLIVKNAAATTKVYAAVVEILLPKKGNSIFPAPSITAA